MSSLEPCSKWIGVDFDGTLNESPADPNSMMIEDRPIMRMVERVRKWISLGIEVRIVTARMSAAYGQQDLQTRLIQDWCQRFLDKKLKVQIEKCCGMIELWDDKAVRVEKNTGKRQSWTIMKDIA